VALTGPGVRPGTLEEASITDIAPTVLYLLDEPIPDDLNGEVLQTAFTSEWQSTHSVIKRPFVSITGQQERLEEGEIAIVEDRLRSLGYLV
jgi:arylsulfatase A-like enzyme